MNDMVGKEREKKMSVWMINLDNFCYTVTEKEKKSSKIILDPK